MEWPGRTRLGWRLLGPLAAWALLSTPNIALSLTDYERRVPGWYPAYSRSGWLPHGDIDGDVGYPLNIEGPRGICLPDSNWQFHYSVVSGTLPPGLRWNNPRYGDISGIPRERGHWVVHAKVDSIICNGKEMLRPPDTIWQYRVVPPGSHEEWQLRFHVRGGGKVIE